MFNGNGAIVGQINRVAIGPNIGPIGGATESCPSTGCPITDPGGAPAAPPPAPPPVYSPPAVPPGGGGAPPPSGAAPSPSFPSAPSGGYPSGSAPWTPPSYGPYGPGPFPGSQGGQALPPGVYTQDQLFGPQPAQAAPAAPVDKTDVMALPEALRRTVIDAMSRGTNPEAIDKLADALIGAGFSKAGRRLRGVASALRVTESALVGQYWGRAPGIPQLAIRPGALRPQIGPFDFSGRPTPSPPSPSPSPSPGIPVRPVPVPPRPRIDPYLVRVSPLAGIRWMAVKLVEPTKDMLPRDGTGMPVIGTEMTVMVRGFGDYVTDPSPVYTVRVRVVRRSSITRNGATARFLVAEIVDVFPFTPTPSSGLLPLPMNGDLVLVD